MMVCAVLGWSTPVLFCGCQDKSNQNVWINHELVVGVASRGQALIRSNVLCDDTKWSQSQILNGFIYIWWLPPLQFCWQNVYNWRQHYLSNVDNKSLCEAVICHDRNHEYIEKSTCGLILSDPTFLQLYIYHICPWDSSKDWMNEEQDLIKLESKN